MSFSCGLRHIRGRRSEASFLRPAFFVNRKDIHKDVLSLAEISGIEPLLFVCLKASLHPDKEEPEILRFRVLGGDKRDRTADLLNAIQALSQLCARFAVTPEPRRKPVKPLIYLYFLHFYYTIPARFGQGLFTPAKEKTHRFLRICALFVRSKLRLRYSRID